MEPRVLAEEMGPESGGAVFRAPEEGVSERCVCPPAEPDPPLSPPLGSVLRQWVVPSPVQESG